MKRSIGIGRCGMGATILGDCRWEQDTIGGICLIGSDCGGGVGYLYLLQRSIAKPDCEDEGYGEKSGTGNS